MAYELYEPSCWDLRIKEIGDTINVSVSNTDVSTISLQQYLMLIAHILDKLRPGKRIAFFAKFYSSNGDFDTYLLRLSERGSLTLVDYPPNRYFEIFGIRESDA